MPDKQQNIVINYKFNTAEIDKANASLNRANQASNILQSSGQKAGAEISRGFQQGQRSILSMENELVRLRTQIQVATNPQRFQQLSAQYKKLDAEIKRVNKTAFETPKALKQTGAATKSLTSQFGNLYTAARLFITAGIVREVFNITIGMAELSGNVKGVETAFRRAFPNSVKLLKDLKDATSGTISEFDLMKKTLQATNLGVPVEELATFFEFAKIRAQQTGESVEYLTDSIVTGLGRKSTRVIDNLGISATRLRDQFKGVSLEALSVAEVTKGVSNIIQEEMDRMGGYVETAKTKVDQLKVAFEDLRIALSKKLETSGLIDFLTRGLRGAEFLLDPEKRSGRTAARELAGEEAARIKESQSFKDLGEDRQKQIDFIQQEINSRVQLIGRYNDNITALQEEKKEIADINPYDKKIDAINRSIVGYKNTKFVVAATILALKEYRDQIGEVSKEEVESLGIIERKKEEIKSLQEQIEKTNNRGDLGAGGRLTKALVIAQAELADLQRAFIDFKPKEFDDRIKNTTENIGALSDAFDRATKNIEESIKRLANTPQPDLTSNIIPLDFIDKIGIQFQDNWRQILSDGIDVQADFLNAAVEQEADSLKQRLDNLHDFYDQQILLAGENDKAKEILRIKEARETARLRSEIARKEKQARRTQVIIDIAAGIAKAFATYPWPYSLIPAAFVAAEGATQLAIVEGSRTNFAKGVIDLKGPGTGTSDSIPANLSKGESVMTAWETKNAGTVLKDVRAKKLDDKVLQSLKEGRGPVQRDFNDERIIQAIKAQKQPDVVKIGSTLYDIRRKTDTYKKRIRNSSMPI